MDMTTIDVTDAPHATVGDEVTLLDTDPFSPASVYELAKHADTIPYEIFARIGPRVRRVAIDPVEETDSIDSNDQTADGPVSKKRTPTEGVPLALFGCRHTLSSFDSP